MTFQEYKIKSDKPLLILSLAFLLVLLSQMLSVESSVLNKYLEIVNWLIWGIFVVDYLVSVYLVPEKTKWVIKHPLELLIVVVPFLRPLRLLRALPLVVQLFNKSRSNLSGKALSVALMGLIFFIVPGTIVFYLLESSVDGSKVTSWGDSIWWAITTVTTVGYGDIYPVTTAGRFLSAVVMLMGITFIGILTAAIASWFVKESQEETESELSQVLKRLDSLEKEIMRLK